MKPKGRISKAALAIASITPNRPPEPRLRPPDTLSTAELGIWHQTVGALPGNWFTPEQAGLVALYARHLARAEQIEALLAGVDPVADVKSYVRLSRLAGEQSARVLGLARALRITVASRTHKDVAATKVASWQPVNTPEDDARAVAALVAWRRGEPA